MKLIVVQCGLKFGLLPQPLESWDAVVCLSVWFSLYFVVLGNENATCRHIYSRLGLGCGLVAQAVALVLVCELHPQYQGG